MKSFGILMKREYSLLNLARCKKFLFLHYWQEILSKINPRDTTTMLKINHNYKCTLFFIVYTSRIKRAFLSVSMYLQWCIAFVGFCLNVGWLGRQISIILRSLICWCLFEKLFILMLLEEVPLLYASQKTCSKAGDKEIEKEMRVLYVIKYLYPSNLLSK